MQLYPHQKKILEETKHQNRVGYFVDMGGGKTLIGSEKMLQLGAEINLVVCQKSKIEDWKEHFRTWYKVPDHMFVCDLTDKTDYEHFLMAASGETRSFGFGIPWVGIINYDLVWRRKELRKLKNFTLILDESSLIQNETSKRSKFILSMNPQNVILLSGTPCSGKYENLWSQVHLLGWDISKTLYWRQYVETETLDNEGYPITVIRGYKNVERLKRKLREHGAVFLKSEEMFDLPEQVHQTIKIPVTKEYRKFRRKSILLLDAETGKEAKPECENVLKLVGDTTLTKMLYERQLCGQYNAAKLEAFRDLLESTRERMIVFYSFNEELNALKKICKELDRPCSTVNGAGSDLSAYERENDSVTLIQYQAGAMGLNLQKACRTCYFTPTLSSELFEQSKKRVHRLGQNRTCYYYYLTCPGSIEKKIYETLGMRRNYTEALFENEKGE